MRIKGRVRVRGGGVHGWLRMRGGRLRKDHSPLPGNDAAPYPTPMSTDDDAPNPAPISADDAAPHPAPTSDNDAAPYPAPLSDNDSVHNPNLTSDVDVALNPAPLPDNDDNDADHDDDDHGDREQSDADAIQYELQDLHWEEADDNYMPRDHPFTATAGIQVDTEGFSPADFYGLFLTDDLI